MKLNHLLLPIILGIFIATNSCKKDQPISDWNGEFIASRFVENSLGTTDTTYSVFALFGPDSITQTVNSVSANGIHLVDTNNFYSATIFYANNIDWVVSGNSSLGIPSFNYVDPIVFPPIPQFSVPPTISLNDTLTVYFSSVAEGTTTINCTINNTMNGSNYYNKNISVNSTSVSFSPAEITSVGIVSGDELGININTVKYTTETFGGKEYYFEKESGFSGLTVAY